MSELVSARRNALIRPPAYTAFSAASIASSIRCGPPVCSPFPAASTIASSVSFLDRTATFPASCGIRKVSRQLRLAGGGGSLLRTALRSNSLLTGKNTGNFLSFGVLIPGASGPKRLILRGFCCYREVFALIEQGIARRVSGNLKLFISELLFSYDRCPMHRPEQEASTTFTKQYMAGGITHIRSTFLLGVHTPEIQMGYENHQQG